MDDSTQTIVYPADYKVDPTGKTSSSKGIQQAIDDCRSKGGGVVKLPRGVYRLDKGLITYPNIMIVGSGISCTLIDHVSNDFAIQMISNQDYSERAGVYNLSIRGNDKLNAAAIEVVDTLDFELDHLQIENYVNGVGVKITNRNYWAEGTFSNELIIKDCKVGIQFERQNGTNSFGYTRLRNFMINVPSGGIGIDLGGTTGKAIYIYHSILQGTLWLDESKSAIGMVCRGNVLLEKSNLFIVGEGWNSDVQLGIKMEGGTIKGEGFINIAGVGNDLKKGSMYIRSLNGALDNKSGTDSNGNAFTAMLTENPDVYHVANYGFYSRDGIDSPYISMYDSGDNALLIKAVPYNSTPSAARTVFQVGRLGELKPQVYQSGAGIYSGKGDPSGKVSASVGSIYMRTDGGSKKTLYVKESGGTGSSGWIAK
ncbi:glycoside hydrolase family 55 protein [Cohnella sp. WQ 127256]|uniref:glycoside hydrolase family 55 protein n=1 Tax=Cohnella sp. WQ 127256 TaxID=2938790 RepID=UPI002118F985|nr:glycoside hydrolase family 55 protein [Cohnella sp. WQ 127256]